MTLLAVSLLHGIRFSIALILFFAHFGTSTFLLLYIHFEQLCVVPI